MEYAIETAALTKDYGDFVLDHVDLTLPGGTILGLIGENGAGKSTLIKCLLGIVRPTAGETRLLGQPAAQALAEVGYVPDQCPFSGHLRVSQVGGVMAGTFPSWDSDLWTAYTGQFALPLDRKVKDLSRGMQMKLSIAAALAHRPKLLLLDEATAGLDPVVRDEILDIFLAFIQDEDHAILISSHITSDLEKVCDYVTYLHKGKVTISGEKDALLARYGKVSCAKDRLSTIDPTLLVGVRQGSYGCQALVRDRAALKRTCPDLTTQPPTLEDLMIFTTRGDTQ